MPKILYRWILIWWTYFSGLQNFEELAEELYKPIIRKFKKTKVHSFFIENIWDADLADMQLISKFNKWIPFVLCVIDIYRKYAWVIPLKYKKGISKGLTWIQQQTKQNMSR